MYIFLWYIYQTGVPNLLGLNSVEIMYGGNGMEMVQTTAIILAAVGALNWGLVGLFKFDLVALIAGGLKFGDVNALSRIIYVLVAIAGIISVIGLLGM